MLEGLEKNHPFYSRSSREILLKEQKEIFDLENEDSTFIGNIIASKAKDAFSHHQK
jgi:hypothetical protein